MKVWKFVLEDPETTVQMPAGAEVLSIGVQREQVCLWALVDPLQPVEPRRFVVVGTGWDVPGHGRFLGTVLLASGELVFHIWEAAR